MANLTWRQVKWHVNYTNVKSQNSGFNYGKKVSLSDYKIDAKLGNRVRFGHLKTSKQAVAIKMFQKDAIQDDNLQYILIEKRVRSSLEVYQRHFFQILLTSANQYIPKLLATFETEDYFYLIQNFIPGGDIFYHMTKKRDFTND